MNKEFKKIDKKEFKKLSREEQIQYYKDLRAFKLTEPFDKKKLSHEKIGHNLLVNVIALNRILMGQKLHVLNSPKIKVDRPLIFAPTHNGKFDIHTLAEVIKSHHYHLVSGDHADLPGTMDGFMLEAAGVIYVDRQDKSDRRVSKETSIRTLQNGGNLMLYPEGTWNLSQNKLVLPLYKGIIDIARKSNALVVPVGLETREGKNYYVNIGEPIDLNNLDDDLHALQILRDELASLKWQIYEKAQTNKNGELVLCKRTDVSIDDFEKYIEERLAEVPYVTREDIIGNTRVEDGFDDSPKRKYN